MNDKNNVGYIEHPLWYHPHNLRHRHHLPGEDFVVDINNIITTTTTTTISRRRYNNIMRHGTKLVRIITTRSESSNVGLWSYIVLLLTTSYIIIIIIIYMSND